MVQFTTRRVVINGIAPDDVYLTMPRREKRELEGQRVERAAIERWAEEARGDIAAASAAIEQRASDTMGMLHDVQTAASTVMRSAEAFVDQQPGASFEEKLDALVPAAATVVHSVRLLQARLGLMPLLTNPDAARYGQLRSTPVYKVVDRIVRILRPVADRQGLRLKLEGASFNRPRLYESFETIPLVLIENAIKYSAKGQDVLVNVEDLKAGVRLQVTSFSPRIADSDKKLIFERGGRAKSSESIVSKGSGLGLYLARLVADAHALRIDVSSVGAGVLLEGLDYCTNTFSIDVA
jgi:signal transduction histidine kinase